MRGRGREREGEGGRGREREKRKEVRMRKGGGKSVRKEGERKTEKAHSHKCTNQIYTTIQKCI